MKKQAERAFIDAELLMLNNSNSVGINTKQCLLDVKEIDLAINSLMNKKYTEKEVDDILTRQREICCEAMEDWCEKNSFKKSGHIVLYAPRP